jgi:hypothetical protein
MKVLGKIIGQCDEEEGLLKKLKQIENSKKLEATKLFALTPWASYFKTFMVVINAVVQ